LALELKNYVRKNLVVVIVAVMFAGDREDSETNVRVRQNACIDVGKKIRFTTLSQ
jgi:5,10-methylene-tetrahydrofolate dehydrogenase/methenyl tetrahydrofolate cyclohydrolase